MRPATDTTVGIVGVGALGGLLGGYLLHRGIPVSLVGNNPDTVARIRMDGLTISKPDGTEITVEPTITDRARELSPVDVLFVCVKAIHTEQAIQDALPVVHDDTIVVTVQNGLKNVEILSEYVDPERVVGGTTTEGASLETVGHVLYTGQGETKLGGPDDHAAQAVVDLLIAAGFEATVVSRPAVHIWEKQLVNVAIKPTAALTELHDGPLGEHEETAWVMEQLVEEAMAVARAHGVELRTDEPMTAVRTVCSVNFETKSSMLEDVQKHRMTEIDHINGAIVEYADAHGIDVPFNRMATALVKGKEYSYADSR